METQNMILVGVFGGFIISQTINFFRGLYKSLVTQEKIRTEMCAKNFTDMNERMEIMERKVIQDTNNIVNKYKIDVDKRLSFVLATLLNTSMTEKGSYKTYLSLFGDNKDFIQREINNMNEREIDMYKKLLDDIENRQTNALFVSPVFCAKEVQEFYDRENKENIDGNNTQIELANNMLETAVGN